MIDPTNTFGIQNGVLFNVVAVRGVVTAAAIAAQGAALIGGSAIDGQTFTLHSSGESATFTYRVSPSGPLEFDFDAHGDHFLTEVINRAAMGITAAHDGSGALTFLADTPGAGGNIAIENHCSGLGSIVGMTGGVDALTSLSLGDEDTAATIDALGTLSALAFSGSGERLTHVLTYTGSHSVTEGSSYDFSNAASVILPPGITFQVRHGDYDELQETILANAELGFTDDTSQLFVGDGTHVGGRQVGLRRFSASGWFSGSLNVLLGTPSSPDVTLITGSSDRLVLVAGAGGEWLPLITVKRPAGATTGTYTPSNGSLLSFSHGSPGTTSSTGESGLNGRLQTPFMDFVAGNGGSTTSTGIGGAGGGLGSIFNLRAGHGGNCTGSGGAGFGTTISDIVTVNGGNGGNVSGPGSGGPAGSITNAFVLQVGAGGASSGSGAGGSSGMINALFSISTGNGGNATNADGGNAGFIDSPLVVKSGHGGQAGSGPGANGGNSGGVSGGVTISSGNGGNGGAGADCIGGDGGAVYTNALSLFSGHGGNAGASFSGANGGDAGKFSASGGNGGDGSGTSAGGHGGASGSIVLSGGHGSTNSFSGGAGGSITLSGTNASSSTGGINGGSIVLSNGVNTIRTSAPTPCTFTLPATTSNGALDTRPGITSNATAVVSFNADGQHETIYNPSASTIASATITLPTTSLSGQILRYVTKGALTAVTMAGAAVDIGSAPTSLAANGVLEWQCVTPGHFIRLR